MNQILSMREKRANLWDAAKKYRDSHISEDGTMNAEDAATYDRMVDDVDRMKTEIDRLERRDAIDAEMNAPTSAPLVDRPMQNMRTERPSRADNEYKKAFWDALRSKAPSSEVLDALQVGVGSEGGVRPVRTLLVVA